ncbi:hypothetical protein MSAN_01158800 [Mycena sanguinolenta]|uniref:Uncharacterized protein n=1 Tax=Mycena sanguinolenta TaxID=230812 RepID=A0A8H6YNT8_9AGAR|nr:hypothetical protein MSAN_01158800 [Mycena sanguinolenta]
MATGAKQSTSATPHLKQGSPGPRNSPRAKSATSSTPSSSADSFMTARASATPTLSPVMTSRLSSTPSPRTPSPNPTSFIQEIDVFMDNIGRLVKALEDQHKQRRFDLGDGVKEPPSSNQTMRGPNGSPSFQSSTK